MQAIKTRFYFDKTDGNIFFQSNLYSDISVEDEILKFVPLKERVRETFDAIDINQPEEPPIYQKPLSEQINDVRLEMARGNSELFETMILLTGGGF